MKKIISFSLCLLILLLSGCRTVSKNRDSEQLSSGFYSENQTVSTTNETSQIIDDSSDNEESVNTTVSSIDTPADNKGNISSKVEDNNQEKIEEDVTKVESPTKEEPVKNEQTVENKKPVKNEEPVKNNEDTDKEEPDEGGIIIDDEVGSTPVEDITPADINTKGEKPLYFNNLTDSQKEIYRYMKTAVEEMKEGFFSLGAARSDQNRLSDIAIAYRALSADNPQYFWLSNSYIMTSDGSSMAFSFPERGADYSVSRDEKEKLEKKLNAKVSELTSQANKLSSRYEKELFFHDWLCMNVTYADDGTENVFNAYGALINGVAVCEGYSRAMQLLCDSVGIPCTVVYGSSRGVGHMWNVVNPGDGWYHLDVTWDDDEDYDFIRHAYFNVDDDEISIEHKIFDTVIDGNDYSGSDNFNIHVYKCNSEKYNYFVKNNIFFTADSAANAKIVADAAAQGKNSIEVYYSKKEYVSLLNDVNNKLNQNGLEIWIKSYSYLGNGLVLWW